MSDDFDLDRFDGIARLFPLPGVTLFPHAVLPLHIFEPRYRQMTADALAADRLITIVQAREPDGDPAEGEPILEEVACLGKIIRWEQLPDGRYNFLLVGLRRIRLVEELATPTLYRQARAELLDDIPPADADPAPAAELSALFRRLAHGQGNLDPEIDRLLDAEPPLGILTDLLAHALPLPPALKQSLLAERHVGRRAEILCALLHRLLPPDQPTHRYPPPINLN